MKQAYVIEFLELFEQNGIEVIFDGGWGVDALLGEQTREHADLDIAVERKDMNKLRELLENRGYKHESRNDDQEYMFVLADDSGHKIDIHSYEFDENHKNIWGIEYPNESLQGKGKIGDKQVKCISPEWVVHFHCQYEPKQKDIDEVKLLCQKFNLKIPEKYQKLIIIEK